MSGVKRILIYFLVSYIISVAISLVHWSGVIIGMIIGGYLCKKYKYSIFIGIIGGLTVWPTIFLIKIIYYGEAATKAFSMVGLFFYLAILFGFILSIISAIIGASLRNIVDSLKS